MRAFTLIELLVAIIIIAVLVAILLPLLSRGREQGRRAMCAGQLKQWFIVAELYANDESDWYPGVWSSGQNNMILAAVRPMDGGFMPRYLEGEPHPDDAALRALPASIRMERDYGWVTGLRRCPSVAASRDYYESLETAQGDSRTDYFGWFGRASGGQAQEDFTDWPVFGWNIGGGGYWWDILWWHVPGYHNPQCYFGPTWRRTDKRDAGSLLAMDRHFVKHTYSEGQWPYVQNGPKAPSDGRVGYTSNHGRSAGRTTDGRYTEYAEGAHALVLGGAVKWQNLTGRVWPISGDASHEFYVSDEAYWPPKFTFSGMPSPVNKPYIALTD